MGRYWLFGCSGVVQSVTPKIRAFYIPMTTTLRPFSFTFTANYFCKKETATSYLSFPTSRTNDTKILFCPQSPKSKKITSIGIPDKTYRMATSKASGSL